MSLLGSLDLNLNSTATSGVDSPFDAETYIAFPGSTLSAWNPNNIEPGTVATSATGSANVVNPGLSPATTGAGVSLLPFILLGGGILAAYLFLHHKIKI